ncbi:MAG: NitT/TauT family transport system ATP-binding protein [Candidatus Azotimanducaceae bacterium]|jgi:NitT/TauT family transport system ATP-binding protein
MIYLDQVSHRYPSQPDGEFTFQDVSLSIGRNQFVTVVGLSGCGKSTLLSLLAGLEFAEQGTLLINETQVSGPDPATSMMFQQPTLLPWISVIKNVLFPLKISHSDLVSGRIRALELLSLCGLEAVANALPHQLSGGMQQRVALCRALISNPALLLMDEPFGALDALTREIMGKELLKLRQQQPHTVVMVTHSIEEATLLSDQVVIMAVKPCRIRRIINITQAHPRDPTDPAVIAHARIIRDCIFEAETGPSPFAANQHTGTSRSS